MYKIFRRGVQIVVPFFNEVSFPPYIIPLQLSAQNTIAASLFLFDNHRLTWKFIQQMHSLFSYTGLNKLQHVQM